jgi:hypothetical protein
LTEQNHDDIELAVQMRQLLYGQLVSRALCAVAALDIPNIMSRGQFTVEELAAKSGADPRSLYQLLRALVPFGVFIEDDGTFGLTPLGGTLRSDATASALPTAMLVHGEVGQAWNEFLRTIQTGEPSFRSIYGTDFFAYLDRRPELHAIFHKSQQHGLTIDLEGILRRVDFADRAVVVDVGGGDGALLEAVLTRYSSARGILVDLPTVVAKADLRFAAAGLTDRTELYDGDFLVSVPSGGDLYMLRQITHDLNDERCAALLSSCRRAMALRDTVLLIMDLIADDRPSTDTDARVTAIMNLYMMSIFGGRERTRAEFERLLVGAGFVVESVAKVAGQMTAITARPA